MSSYNDHWLSTDKLGGVAWVKRAGLRANRRYRILIGLGVPCSLVDEVYYDLEEAKRRAEDIAIHGAPFVSAGEFPANWHMLPKSFHPPW